MGECDSCAWDTLISDACVTVVAGSQRCPSGVHDHAGMLMTHESACEACGMAQLAISRFSGSDT
jgi:hypothetical protein